MARKRQARLDARPDEQQSTWSVLDRFDAKANVVLHTGEALDFLRSMPSESVGLVVSSPPYNVGKEYEVETELEEYLEQQKPILQELVRVLAPHGSLCWQVGNYVKGAESFPLDIYYYPLFKGLGLRLRNRIVWHFGHGVHTEKRLSPRYETLLWFTKGDHYTFNLDSIRVASKYPGKRHFKGAKAGQPSGNPLGKNPSDFWEFLREEWSGGIWEIPNVKAAHPEKTVHPCQFPVELVERCVLAFTQPGDWVLDPFGGVGTTAIAALKRDRRAISVDRESRYSTVARRRIEMLEEGTLQVRRIGKPVMQPNGNEKWAKVPDEWKDLAHSIY